MAVYAVDKLMNEARRLAAEYRRATGRPLAIGGEIAKYDAARLLGLEPVEDPEAGYDAIGTGRRAGRRVVIKGRAIFDERKSGQRIGQLRLERPWDLLMVVLLDESFEPAEIYEIERADVEAALAETSQRRSRRGAMSVARVRTVGRRVWSRELGEEDDGYWDNRAAGES